MILVFLDQPDHRQRVPMTAIEQVWPDTALVRRHSMAPG